MVVNALIFKELREVATLAQGMQGLSSGLAAMGCSAGGGVFAGLDCAWGVFDDSSIVGG